MHTHLRGLLVVLALTTGAPFAHAGWRPAAAPRAKAAPSRPVARPTRAPVPRVRLDQAQALAGQVYDESSGLKVIGGLMARNPTDRQAERLVDRLGQDIHAKHGLRVKLVPNRAKVPGLTPYPGANPGKWDDAGRVIYLRKGMPAQKLLRELGHEYGAFLLARKVGGRANIPRVGDLPIFATHLLDDVIAERR